MPQRPLQDPHGSQYSHNNPEHLSPLSEDFDSEPELWPASAEAPPNYNSWHAESGPRTRDVSMFQTNSGQSRQSPVDSPSPPATSTKPTQHAWIQRSQVTSSKALNHLVLEFAGGGVKSFFCGWTGCKHPVGFAQKPQLITHIRSAHLQEKPFLCTTCNTLFARKQEASRHVLSLNSGRKYKCSGCHQAFSRKNYRDAHEEYCMCEESNRIARSQRPSDRSVLSARPQAHDFL